MLSKIKPGSLVINLSSNTFARVFPTPAGMTRDHIGILTGIGLVIERRGADIKVASLGGIGWLYAGNVMVVE